MKVMIVNVSRPREAATAAAPNPAVERAAEFFGDDLVDEEGMRMPSNRHSAAGILGVVDDVDASLVALSTHGRTAMGRLTLGRVSGAVIHAAPCPVLTTAPEASGQRLDRSSERRLGRHMDGEELDVFEAMHTARAMRWLRQDPVPPELIRTILEAAVAAPNGGNRQTWGFIVVTDAAIKATCSSTTPRRSRPCRRCTRRRRHHRA